MFKITVDVNPQQIENLVEHLPMREKIHLAKRLNEETWEPRFKSLLKEIDTSLKRKHLPSNEEIVQIVKKVRRRRYAQSHH